MLPLGGGCAQLVSPPPEASLSAPLSERPLALDAKEEGVIRGQSPQVAQSPVMAPWGPAYLAPGEASCNEPPFGYEGGTLPPGYYIAPQQQPAPQPATPQSSWLDILPPEAGSISPDFGLPTSPTISNRVPNPIFVPSNNPDAAWETIASTLSEYFPIESEQRVQQTGTVLTEGRLETSWQTAATVLEPWRNDSVGSFNRWQSTLQTIRRRSTVRVIPASGGYEIGVRVENQLEDLNRPELASAGAASLRNDSSLPTDRLNAIDNVIGSVYWIDIGRDEPLEQELLRRFRDRLSVR